MKTLALFLILALAASVATAQWVQTNGPYGGSISCFAVSGTNLFAGTDGGVFLSTNNGASWTAVNEGLPRSTYDTAKCYIQCLASSGPHLFAGTMNGVFLSTNNGTSWTAVSSGSMNTWVDALAVSPAAGGTGGTNLFAGISDGGVFLSTNNGTSWTAVNNGLTHPWVKCFAVSGTNIFAGTSVGGVFLSTNNGTSWTAVNSGLTNTDVNALAVSDTNLFAGTWGGGVFRSTNHGTSWTAAGSGLPSTASVVTLAVSPVEDGTGGTNLFAGSWWGDGVYLSTNNGTSWMKVNIGLGTTFINAFAVMSNGGDAARVFTGTNGGVFLSTNNGTSWTAVSTGLSRSSSVSALGSHPNAGGGLDLFVGTCRDVRDFGLCGTGTFRSNDNGLSWAPLNFGLPPNTPVTAFAFGPDEKSLIVGTSSYERWDTGGVYVSTNSGASWTPANSGLTCIWVNAVAVSGTNIFAGTAGGVFLSTNNGTSWTAVNSGLPSNTDVGSFAVSGTNVFATIWGSGVFLSTNNGTDWTPVNAGLPRVEYGGIYVSAIAVKGSNVFVGAGSGVYLTTNNGGSWTAVGSGLSANMPIGALAVDGTNLFAGADSGRVFLSTNNGTSWIAVNSGLPTNTYVGSLAVSGTNVFAGTGGCGVWKRPLSEMITSAGRGTGELPHEFSLSQNYPNPFNPSTTIRYGLPHKLAVHLTVFNALGQQVSHLVSGNQEAGYHEVQFDASGLSSGVYFYRLRAGDLVDTKRFLVIR